MAFEGIEYTTLKRVYATLASKFPNELPRKLLSEVEMAQLVGQQDVLRYFKALMFREDTDE